MRNCRKKLSVLVALCVCVAGSHAQVPTLDPEKTVNPATGEMAFKLNLGVVQGINGGDYPIDIYYKAGIGTSQRASAVGLGFSIGPGGISRKVVHVPDDLQTGRLSYAPGEEVCRLAHWKEILSDLIELVVTVVTAMVTQNMGCGALSGMAVGMMISAFADAALEGTLLSLNPSDFRAAGTHVPSYNYVDGDRTGFLEGGKQDSPDIYTLHTPYLSGQLVWVGDAEHGHFVLRSATGSTLDERNSVAIHYQRNADVFRVTLNDGTRLYFEERLRSASYVRQYYSKSNEDGDWCNRTDFLRFKQASTNQWLLTKVLFADYVDGNGDLDPQNSTSSNKGAWIAFEYDGASNLQICQTALKHGPSGPDASCWAYIGKVDDTYDDVELHWLSSVVTPAQRADFSWEERLDDVWSYTSSPELWGPVSSIDFEWTPYKSKRLDKITIKNAGGQTLRRIEFQQGYDLRPQSVGAFVHATDGGGLDRFVNRYLYNEENAEARVLTLRGVKIRGAGNVDQIIVRFGYVDIDPVAYHGYTRRDRENTVLRQPRDLWGYYFPNDAKSETGEYVGDYNMWGTYENAHNDDGEPWASAWSLESVELPTGGTVRWEYEANRYDMANNVPATSVSESNVPRYGGGIRVKKVLATDRVGGAERVLRYYYTAGDPTNAGYFSETNTNSSGHATCEPYPFFTQSDNRNVKARGGNHTGCKVAYEQTTVVRGTEEGNVVAPNGYTVYNFTTNAEHANGGAYGEIDSTWKRGHISMVRQYSKERKLVAKTTFERDFIDEPSIYSLPPDANVACAGRWFLLSKQNTLGTVVPRSKTVTVDGVSNTTEYRYATDEEVDEPNDVVFYSKDDVTTIERSWGDVGEPGYREGAFDVCNELGDPAVEDVAAVYSLYNAMRVKIYTDIGTSAESVKHTSFVPRYGSGITGVPRVIGAAFWELNGSEPANPDLIIVVARYTQMECYVLWDVADGIAGEPTYFPLITVGTDHWEIVSCAIGQLNSNPNPDLLFYEGDYDVTGKMMARGFYGVRDLGQDGQYYALGLTYVMRPAGPTQQSEVPWAFAGDDIRFIDYDKDGECDDLEITGPRYENYEYDFDRGWLPHEGYCHHYILPNVMMRPMIQEIVFIGGVKELPTLFEVGPNDEGDVVVDGAYSLRYIGATQGEADGDRLFGFFRWEEPNTYLRLVKVHRATLRRDYDGLPNRVVQSAGDLRLATNSTPAHTVFPQMALGNRLTGTAVVTRGEVPHGANQKGETRVAQAAATTWSTTPYTTAEREFGASPLSDPYPADGATGVERVCDRVLLEWQGASVNGQEVRYEVYVGNDPDMLGLDTRQITPTSANRVGTQLTGWARYITYWQVHAILPDGRTIRGPLWSFTPGESRPPRGSDCGSNEWLDLVSPSAGEQLTPGGLVYIRWLGDDFWGSDVYGCGCVIAEFQNPNGGWSTISDGLICCDGPGSPLYTSRSTFWGHCPWRVPFELAGRQTRIRLRRYCDGFSVGTAETGPLSVAEAPERFSPIASHAWRVPSAASTDPQYAYAPFNFSESAANPNWVTLERTARRGRFSQVLCARNAAGTPSTAIYGHSGRLPAGSVANAEFTECGVFTGDYETSSGGWLDEPNGWGRGTGKIDQGQIPPGASKVELVAEAKHFGDKGLKITNAWGPSRNFKLEKNTSYELSAWIRVAAGSVPLQKGIVMGGDYRQLRATTAEGDFPIEVGPPPGSSGPHNSGTVSLVKEAADGWKLVVMTMPAKQDISDAQWNSGYKYARVWVGCPAGDGSGGDATVYVDDVRFYPTDALVTTRYSDQLWGSTKAAVDENSNAHKYTYDGFGRVSAEYNTAGLKVREYEYHLKGPNNPPPAPTGLSAVAGALVVTFSWDAVVDPDGDDITYSVIVQFETGGEKQRTIKTELSSTSCSWRIPMFPNMPPPGELPVKCTNGCNWYVVADDGRGGTATSAPGTYHWPSGE